jgi:heat shock 70kDa protein 1/2/6/8
MGNESTKPFIGIDLGTEYCCVAVFYCHNRFEIIPNKRKNYTTPSYVAFTDKGRLFGEDAKEQTHLNPTNTVYEMKRLIGRRFDDPKLMFDIDQHWPFKVIDDKGKPKIEISEYGEKKKLLS